MTDEKSTCTFYLKNFDMVDNTPDYCITSTHDHKQLRLTVTFITQCAEASLIVNSPRVPYHNTVQYSDVHLSVHALLLLSFHFVFCFLFVLHLK